MVLVAHIAALCTSGRGGGKGFGGGKGGKGKGAFNEGPPDTVVEMGVFMHPCEGDLVVKSTNEKVTRITATCSSPFSCFHVA